MGFHIGNVLDEEKEYYHFQRARFALFSYSFWVFVLFLSLQLVIRMSLRSAVDRNVDVVTLMAFVIRGS